MNLTKQNSVVVKMIQNILMKVFQHPQFHNTRYTKTHKNNKHGHIVW